TAAPPPTTASPSTTAPPPSTTAPPPVQEAGGPPPLDPAPISLWLSASRVTDKEPTELVAVLVNHDGSEATFGVAARIDRWDGQSWVPHRLLAMCLDHWFCTATPQALGPMVVNSIGLSARVDTPGPTERFSTKGLDQGWYRISQTANEGLVAATILQVVAGADPVAPLVSVDMPAISIAPVLVKPTGTIVGMLRPLVPGINSIAEVERALAGLAETAALERWDGRDWKPIATIALKPAASDPLSRSAELPALAEGDYRLVRAGPNGAHIGRFWVTAAAA
ncbi:MAG: hypothetical protein ABI658_27790, partial [Acidimicrobiales bacterium]